MQLVAHHHTTTTEFEALRAEWTELLARSRQRSVFLTWEWLYAWWRTFGRGYRLLILTVRETNGTLAGLGPFCVHRQGLVLASRAVSFLGTKRVSSEYLDVIAAPDREGEVASAIWDGLLSRLSEWDYLELTDVLDDSIVARFLVPLAAERGYFRERVPCNPCPYMPLPASEEGFWKALSGQMRGAIRRTTRRLEQIGVTYQTTTDPERLPGVLNALYELHGRRWEARNSPGKFQDEPVRQFHDRLAGTLGATGAVRLSTLAHNGRTIAALYTMDYKDTVFAYQSGFDPALPDPSLKSDDYSPGLMLISRCVRDAIARGLSAFDFLRGVEAYKRRWTADANQTWSFTIVPHFRWKARQRHRMRQLVRASKKTARRLVPGWNRSA